MFTTDPALEVIPGCPAFLYCDLHKLPDTVPVDRLEGVFRKNAVLDVFDQKVAFRIITANSQK